MRSASRLSLDEKIRVCGSLYAKGMSTRDIQAETGIGKSSIPGYVRASGMEMDGASRISAKLIGRPGPRAGSSHTLEARAKISAARRGKPTTLGQVRTSDQRARMSAAHRTVGLARKIIRSQRALFRRTPVPKISTAERVSRRKSRDAIKRLLRRVLTMARVRKDAKTEVLLGYTQSQLRAHIESQFKAGMSWETRDSFHIDHVIPVAVFFRRGIFDPAVINALSNLQVLTPEENRAKGDRVLTITDAGVVPGIVGLA